MNSFNLFRLDEANVRKPKYISENEFQFIYDCIHGKYRNILSKNDRDKLSKKIVGYLAINTVFEEDVTYYNCDQAKAYIKNLKKENPTKEDLAKVQLFCSDIPEFMNIHIQKIFDNIKDEANDSLRKKFISLHIDIFIDFFQNREEMNVVTLSPKTTLYEQLIGMYSSKFDGKSSLISKENSDKGKNIIFKIFKEYLVEGHEDAPKSESYSQQDCTKLNETISKLLCALTHRRDTKEAFKFEKSFEHTKQFLPYKGGVKYDINTIDSIKGAIALKQFTEREHKRKIDNSVYSAYVKIILILLNDNDLLETYTNCALTNEPKCLNLNSNLIKKIKDIFINSVNLAMIEHEKTIKGDVIVNEPIPICSKKNINVLDKGDIIELKYFNVNEIIKHKNILHITRILEPNFEKIYENINLYNTTIGYDIKSKFFKNFLKELVNIIIDATQEIILTNLNKVEDSLKDMAGIIIAGPKYIKQEDGWYFFIHKGSDFQQGDGVSINLKLPSGFESKARDLKYIEKTNSFCFVN